MLTLSNLDSSDDEIRAGRFHVTPDQRARGAFDDASLAADVVADLKSRRSDGEYAAAKALSDLLHDVLTAEAESFAKTHADELFGLGLDQRAERFEWLCFRHLIEEELRS